MLLFTPLTKRPAAAIDLHKFVEKSTFMRTLLPNVLASFAVIGRDLLVKLADLDERAPVSSQFSLTNFQTPDNIVLY